MRGCEDQGCLKCSLKPRVSSKDGKRCEVKVKTLSELQCRRYRKVASNARHEIRVMALSTVPFSHLLTYCAHI